MKKYWRVYNYEIETVYRDVLKIPHDFASRFYGNHYMKSCTDDYLIIMFDSIDGWDWNYKKDEQLTINEGYIFQKNINLIQKQRKEKLNKINNAKF